MYDCFLLTFIGIVGMQSDKAYAYSTGSTFTIYITTSDVNIRKGPGTSYESYGVVPKYTAIDTGQVKETSGGWSKVEMVKSGSVKTGYIKSSYLRKSTSNRFYKATSNVKVRKGPGTSYSAITTVPKNADQLLFYDYKVYANGHNWVADLSCKVNSPVGSTGYDIIGLSWTAFDYYR
ncbi:mannosyl-glycoprotein endo-beta-N-acetylglucosamidase [Clostridium botulinum]|nr:mannosyl-glycoprotein endo-beta-N-acetylglucosamidase [Clostridium botulinum]